jgi:hypothetical protein
MRHSIILMNFWNSTALFIRHEGSEGARRDHDFVIREQDDDGGLARPSQDASKLTTS